MLRKRWWLVGSALWSALALPTLVGRVGQDPGTAQGAALVINEVQYDPPSGGSESRYEWVELYNPGAAPVGLAGWQLADARDAAPLPDVAVPPGAFLVVAAGDGFAEQHPGFAGQVVVLGGRIGNGLGNTGDQVRLLAPDGSMADGLSYGDDAGVLNPAAPDVPAEHSLAREPVGRDTDTAADWADQAAPSPGEAGAPVVNTPPPATSPPSTVGPGARVVLNEYLPAPKAIDWDGDGQVTTADEWVELYNAGDVSISLRGWLVDDVADSGSTPYALPDGADVPPHGFLVVFGKDSKVQLNNGGDSVRLLHPDGTVADETAFTKSTPDGAYARLGDGDGPWTDTLPPSPGQANPAGALPTGTPATPATPGGSPRATATPAASRTPRPTATGAATPAGPRGTPVPAYLPMLLLSEVMADPLLAGDDAAEEWVELYNRSDAPVSLAGWALGDAVAWDALAPAVVPARGFLVVTAGRGMSATLAAAGVPVTQVADRRIGNGLANKGDEVRLRGPTGALADAMSYGASLAAFDPAVPLGPPGVSWERIPPDVDTDSADDWWPQPAPAPGHAGLRHLGAPLVVLNEVLPVPRRVDWDGDGVADHTDEWLELANRADHAVRLAGWRLEVGGPDGWDWRFPDEARVAAGGYLVLSRAATGLALVNDGDTVRLRRDDGVVADTVTWSASPGYDRSLGRLPDGTGSWASGLGPTPGGPNHAAGPAPVMPPPRTAGESAPEPAPDMALGALRVLRAGARVRVTGRVTAVPGRLGRQTAYLGDETGGVRLYLDYTDAPQPIWAEGERVTAVGRLADYHGERQVVVERATDAWSAGPAGPIGRAGPVAAVPVRTGEVGEAAEGRLVALTGRVVAATAASFSLDDGSGAARVTVLAGTGVARPAARRGERLRVTGVVSQSASRAPWLGGYRLLVRGPADLARAKSGPARPRGPVRGIAPRPPAAAPRRGSPAGSRVVLG